MGCDWSCCTDSFKFMSSPFVYSTLKNNLYGIKMWWIWHFIPSFLLLFDFLIPFASVQLIALVLRSQWDKLAIGQVEAVLYQMQFFEMLLSSLSSHWKVGTCPCSLSSIYNDCFSLVLVRPTAHYWQGRIHRCCSCVDSDILAWPAML